MKWTNEQQQVIDLRNRNILVSAAAGSGKTAVLVERIIKKITDKKQPVDIDRLLVVTFTKAAAAEMRERIANAIEKMLEDNPEDENLKRQQTLIHNAQITTIDSFCLFVVRNYFEEIDLDPNFRIADTGEVKLLEIDVLNEVFEKEYQRCKKLEENIQVLDSRDLKNLSIEKNFEEDLLGQEVIKSLQNEKKPEKDRFLQLVDAYSDKRSNKAVKNMVAKIYHQSASNPWPKEWIENLANLYEVQTEQELLESDLIQGICSYVKIVLLEMQHKLVALKEIALAPDGPEKYVATLEKDIALFENIETLHTFEEFQQFFANIKFSTLTAIRGFTGDILKKEAVSTGRNEIKEEIKVLNSRYFSMSVATLFEQLQRIQPMALELIRLAICYMEAMEVRKMTKHVMDFSDVEHAALKILVDEQTKELRPTAMEFQQLFDEIMIDEYQDSNQVQEEIMRAISREHLGHHNMFMVGDVKQSIYRFRLARPELFMEKFNTYELCDSKCQRIDLHKNFRSRNEVVEFTNDIFYKIMQTDLGNVAYDKDSALYCGAEYPNVEDMKAEVLIFDLDETTGESILDELDSRQLEARMVAEKIHKMKQSMQILDKGTKKLRPLRYSDIVILFRSLKGWGNDFVEVLGQCGIPAHVSTSTGYFSAIEVQTMLSLLKILDNPYQDIPMAAVLKSPIVGLDNEELAEIAIYEKNHGGGFAKSALTLMQTETEGRLHYFYQLYQKMREKVSDTPIHELLYYIFDVTGYANYVKALPAGRQRAANLNMLLEKAIAYKKQVIKDCFIL